MGNNQRKEVTIAFIGIDPISMHEMISHHLLISNIPHHCVYVAAIDELPDRLGIGSEASKMISEHFDLQAGYLASDFMKIEIELNKVRSLPKEQKVKGFGRRGVNQARSRIIT